MSPDTARVPAPLAHQFGDLAQQRDTAVFGMWVFLATEGLFFGGLFAVYSVYRSSYPDAFIAGSRQLLVWAGTLNTAVLITSSLTMALAVQSARLGERRAQTMFILITMALGALFLGVKAFEYYTEYTEAHVPGSLFRFEPVAQIGQAQIFFSLYFAMTGLHAVHMAIGLGVLAVMAWQSSRGSITADYYNPLEISGLYWHFVDIVWIFLFPLLYLIGRHVH